MIERQTDGYRYMIEDTYIHTYIQDLLENNQLFMKLQRLRSLSAVCKLKNQESWWYNLVQRPGEQKIMDISIQEQRIN